MPVERAVSGPSGFSGDAAIGVARWGAKYFYRHLYFIVPFLILLQGCLSNIKLPGVYMDAVNPDYLIVRLLNWNPYVYAWVLPGTCILGIFPTIIQLYHGAIPYYIGMPFYVLFGTGVVGIRIANFIFASLVLLSAGVFLRAFGVRSLFVGLALAVLALDPGFLFSFRTQFYITLLPISFVLFSVSLVESAGGNISNKTAAAAGFLIGLSIYGYFIYLFLTPAAAIHLWLKLRSNADRRILAIYWLAGFALGVSPYVIGLALIFSSIHGVQGFLGFIIAYLRSLPAPVEHLDLTQRLKYFLDMVNGTTQFVGPSSMMLSKTYTAVIASWKTLLLLIFPGLVLIVNLFVNRRSSGIILISGFIVGMAGLFMVFGGRLWLHHAALILPLLYLGLALAVEFVAKSASPGRWATWALALPLLILGVGNGIDRHRIMLDLQRTGGVGLASSAIERFAEDSRSNPDPTFAFFPDWGVFMPFEMMTAGKIPLLTDFSPDAARRKLCEGRDALLAIINDKGTDRLAPWIDAVGWGSPEIVVYRQRDNAPVLTAVRWRASSTTHPACMS